MTTPNSTYSLPRLTSLRWYAALVVFLAHLNSFIRWSPLQAFTFGQVGVTFFFVLSGFVLAWSTPTDLPARAFYRRRFARIYPSYMVAIYCGVAVVVVWHQAPVDRSVAALPASLLMVQSWVPAHAGGFPYSFNPPLWSLSCEAFFYACFPFLVRWLRSCGARVQAQVAALALVASLVAGEALSLHGLTQVALDDPLERLAEFVLGIVLALAVQAGWRPRVPVSVAIGLVVASCAMARPTLTSAWWTSHLPFPFEDYLVVVPVGLLLVAAAVADLGGRRGCLTTRACVFLGEVSFAFYLVHYLTTRVLLHVLGWGHTWPGLGGAVPLVVTLSASLGLAVLLHEFVELPMQRRLRQPRTPPAPSVTEPSMVELA